MSWIKYRGMLRNDPRMIRLVNALSSTDGMREFMFTRDAFELDVNSVTKRALQNVTIAALLDVWVHVNEYGKTMSLDVYLRDSNVTFLDEFAGIVGFGEAMLSVGWVKYLDDQENCLVFPNFAEHNETASERNRPMTDAERQQKRRDKKKLLKEQSHETSREVTKSHVHKKRLDKNRIDNKDQKTRSTKGGNVYSEDFERMWLKRPPRAGSDSKKKAFAALNARLKQGADIAVIEAGLDRYCAYILASGDAGTRHVLMMATFFGPDEHYLTPYAITENANGGLTASQRRDAEYRTALDNINEDDIPF